MRLCFPDHTTLLKYAAHIQSPSAFYLPIFQPDLHLFQSVQEVGDGTDCQFFGHPSDVELHLVNNSFVLAFAE